MKRKGRGFFILSILFLSVLVVGCDLSRPLYSTFSTSTIYREPVRKTITPVAFQTNTPTFSLLTERQENSIPTLSPHPNVPTTIYLAPTSTTTFNWNDCHSTYQARLKIGDRAFVSYDPLLANNIRHGPYKGSTLLGKIHPGDDLTIIDGPSCSNGWIWWKIISSADDITGWTAEGDEIGYWLVPIK